MAPLFALIGFFTVFTVVDVISGAVNLGWWGSLRFALAGMFLLTASAHRGRRRPDLIRMVPAALPRPDLVVTITGVLEVVGALALCIPSLAPHAAAGLALMLIAVFPANVRAARERLTIGGQPVLGLGPRALLQVLFLASVVAVYVGAPA